MARLLNMRPDAEVEPWLAEHLTYLTKQNQRPRSIRERRLTVLRVARALGHPVASVTRAELVAWQDSRASLSPAGMHNEIVHVTQYLRWVLANEHRGDDPTPALVRPRHVNQSLPKPMADSNIGRALAAADYPVSTWIRLGAFCGLRCMEIANIEAECIIDGDAPYLRIIGKGGKERIVPLPVALRDELVQFYPAQGHLFRRMDGQPGPPSAMRVSERINDHMHSLGIKHTAHTLRHRFGTKLYEATGDPFLVAQVMGHKSTDTTRGYVEVASQKATSPIEAISHLGTTAA